MRSPSFVTVRLRTLAATFATATVLGGLLTVAAPAHVAAADPAVAPQRDPLVLPALRAVHAAEAWATTRGTGVVVAVIDSGVAGNVVNLRGRVLDGVDLFNPDRPRGWWDPIIMGGHGTGVASVIAGSGYGNGVYGVAPKATILPIRVADASGHTPGRRVARGITYAVDHGAHVINLSLGGTHASPLVHTAVKRAVRRGVVVVAGAGNNGPNNTKSFYPAAFPEAIAVAGTQTLTDLPANFSMRGDWVDIAAPGTRVLATNNDGTRGKSSGTSFATPFVAGAVALMLDVNPDLTPAQVRTILIDTARDVADPGFDIATGHGLLNVAAAVRASVRAGRAHR